MYLRELSPRLMAAIRAGSIHLLCSLGVAILSGILVFGVWYPYPYREMAGGRELFFLVVLVDVICGPLLTIILFNPKKPQKELWCDLGMVIMIQLTAFGYGVHTAWLARPVFLVQEVDRFKVIAMPELVESAVNGIPTALQPHWTKGPIPVAIREPKDSAERTSVLFDSIQGGRDYAERAEFYLPYEGNSALKSLNRAKPLAVFIKKQPTQEKAAYVLANKKNTEISELAYLPIRARYDWIAVLNKKGEIIGFLEGDGF